MKQRNCHARSSKKRKALRLKNRMRSVLDKRAAKRIDALKEKGKPFQRFVNKDGKIITAKDIAIHISSGRKGVGGLFDHRFQKSLNQRQKRKRLRQANLCY